MSMACLVVASGLSRRFGDEDKLLADLKGQALLAYCLDTAASVPFAQRYVVTSDDKRAELAKARGFNIVHNPTPEDGMGTSLALGAIDLLNHGFNAGCILLGDMPFVTPEYLTKLIKHSKSFDISFSQNNNRNMPPAIFKNGALYTLTTLRGDKGMQSQNLSHFNISHLDLPNDLARDMDTPEDFDR